MRNIFKSLFIGLCCVVATTASAEKTYVITSQCNIPLKAGMSSASYQIFTWDGTTQEATSAISNDQKNTCGFYYNSTSLAYSDLTNTGNYSTSSGSSRTLRGIKLAGSATLTVTLNSVAIKKVAVVGRCASNDQCTIDVAGETVTTKSNTTFFVKEVEPAQAFTNKIEIKNNSSKEYNLFVYLIEGVAGPSSDATLKSLSYNGTSVPNFSAETTSYDVELSAGTTTPPTVTAESNDAAAKPLEITQATSLPGTAKVVVTAEDGTTTKEYKINFTVESGKPKVLTATWANIRGTAEIDHVNLTIKGQVTNGSSLTVTPSFTFNYESTVSPEGAQNFATATNNTIEYTFTNKSTSEVSKYKVTITEGPAVSSDATLKSLKYNGTSVPSFAASQLEYAVELAEGTTSVPTVTAEKNDAKASDPVVTPASSLPGTTTVEVTAEDGTTSLTYKINFTVKVPASGLTKHIPDIYDAKTVAGGYGGTLTVDGGREFEVYYVSRTNDSKASLPVTPGDKKTGIEDQATASATYAKAADGWVEANIKSISGGTSAKASAFGEFKELYDEWRIQDNSVKMDIEGFDMFSYYAADKSTEIDSKTGTFKKKQRFQVFIDGVMQPETQCNTNATVRRYEISAGRHVIEVKSMSDGESRIYAFSLRVSDNPRTRYIKGNDSTQVILQTQSPKPVYYFTKYNSKGETKLEWEGNEATGIKLDVKGSTTIGDTLVLSGEANCPVGDYKYHVVTYMNGAETSRASGKFSVVSDIKAISDTIVDAYQQEEMEPIEFRYYALDASAITLTWKNGNAPAGLTTNDDKTKHTFTIGGTTTSSPGKYYYTVTIAGSSTVITGYIEVISQDLGVNPVLYLYQTKSPRRAYEDDGIYAYLKSKGVNLQPRTAIKKLRSAEQYAKFKWILISEDVDADNEEVLAIVKGSDKGGVGLPVLNLKGFTYTPDRLAWGEPDNGSIDTVSNNGCNIYIERADHPIFESFKLKHGAKLQIFNKLQQNGVMPINIDLPGTLCLATAYTRNIEDYYKDGELQTVIHEIPAAMRGGKKYICVPLSMSSSKDLSADGKALFNAIVTYLTDSKEYTITRPTLQINSFSVNKLAATINGDRIDLVYDSIQHPDMNIAALAPEIVLEDEMTHVVPAPGVPQDFTYSLYMPVPYVVTDYINRRVYDVVIQAYGGQGLEETGYTAGEWVNIYDIYGRMITTTNENIYTMPLPRGIYIAVTAEGKSIKVMR